MAKIKFSRKEFEKHIKLSKEIEEKISLFGTHLESLTNDEIELEILPNRPDLFSFQGFIRAFKAFLGKPQKSVYKMSKSDAKIIVDKSVEKVRPYSMAAIVKGVKFEDERIKEIMQWQEKIHATLGRNRKKVALGYYILNKIKFPVRYITKEPKEIVFEPLDMPEKMDALKILSRHPCGREYGNQLNGFDKFPVYYDSNNEVLSLPPIINSNNSGKIISGTADVLIECSGTDLEILKKVMSMAVADLIDLGGKGYSVEVCYGNKTECIDLKPEARKIDINNVNSLLGLNLKEKDLEKLLPKMGYEYSDGKVKVPTWRTDILHEVDIIEDIAIAYGYDNFVPEIPKVATIGQESKESKIKSKISDILVGIGMLEISSYHLIKGNESKNDLIEVINSKTEYKYLRPNILIPALRIFSENKDNEYPQKVFELGVVFEKDKSNKAETGIKESNNLLIACSPGNFTEIKQILDYLSKMLGINITIKEANKQHLIDGRTGSVLLNNEEIGYIGEIHPETLNSWNIKMPISVLEISLDDIFNLL